MKLGMKLLAAPLLTAVVVLLSGQINVALMGREADKGQASSAASLEDFKTVANVQQQLGQVHTSVYKTVALIGSLDDARIKSFRSDLVKQLDGIKRVSGVLAEAAGADAELRSAVAEIGKQLDTYGKQADSAIDLSSVDPQHRYRSHAGRGLNVRGAEQDNGKYCCQKRGRVSGSDAGIAATLAYNQLVAIRCGVFGSRCRGVAVCVDAAKNGR